MTSTIGFSLALTGLLLAACLSDLKAFRIPNAIPLAVIALFLVKAAAMGQAVWPVHIPAFALTLAIGIVAFVFGWLGGGDVKLIAALALWFGMTTLPDFLVITAIGGGVLGLLLMALRPLLARSLSPAGAPARARGPRLLHREAPVPYALAIAFAALLLEWR